MITRGGGCIDRVSVLVPTWRLLWVRLSPVMGPGFLLTATIGIVHLGFEPSQMAGIVLNLASGTILRLRGTDT